MGVVDKPPTLCVCAVFLAAVRLIDPRRQVQFKMRCGWPCVRSTVATFTVHGPHSGTSIRHVCDIYDASAPNHWTRNWRVGTFAFLQGPSLAHPRPRRDHASTRALAPVVGFSRALGTGEAASPQLRDWLRLPGQPLCLH